MRKLLSRLDPHYTKVCTYAGSTVLLTLAAAMVLYFSAGFFVNLWQLICAVLEPAVYGALIAYLLNPIVVRVSRALKRAGWQRENYKVRRFVGIVACLLVLAAVVLGIVIVMTLVITRGVRSVSPETLESMWNAAQQDLMWLVNSVQSRAAEMGLAGGVEETSGGGNIAGMIAGAFKSVARTFSAVLFSVIFSIYYLIDGKRVGGYLLRVMRASLGERATNRILAMLDDADHVFAGYIRGQFTDALVVGVLAAIVLTLVGVPHGPLVGALTGLGNLIPYVGAPLGILTTVFVCVADGELGKIIVGIACLALIMFVDSNVINPKLLSDNVETHPLLVVAALIAGGAVGGLAGMLVAVPMAAFLKIQLDRWLRRREAEGAATGDAAVASAGGDAATAEGTVVEAVLAADSAARGAEAGSSSAEGATAEDAAAR